jgi:tRNA pseudouridine55 synthase
VITLTRDGVLPVDKPEGPTSHDVVAMARRALGTRRVGHTGTLDPFASGLLLLCIDKATRLAEYFSDLPKEYLAVARLGATTDTDDRDGRVLESSDAWRDLTTASIRNALNALVGVQEQLPPVYSAKKVAGERAYDLARRGEAVELKPVQVTVYSIEAVDISLPDLRFAVRCSSGTYVRSIARDLGSALGVGAHLQSLRRTRVGTFNVEQAVTLDQLEDGDIVRGAFLTPVEALRDFAMHEACDAEAAALGMGRAVQAPALLPDGTLVAVRRGAELIAIASVRGGLLQPRKVFAQ